MLRINSDTPLFLSQPLFVNLKISRHSFIIHTRFYDHILPSHRSRLSLLPSIYGLALGFPYGAQKIHGVNIGGWLVLEVYYPNFWFHFLHMLMGSYVFQPWIKPSFSGHAHT